MYRVHLAMNGVWTHNVSGHTLNTYRVHLAMNGVWTHNVSGHTLNTCIKLFFSQNIKQTFRPEKFIDYW